MGWFDEQIKKRKQNDDEMMQEAIAGIVGAVMGKRVAVAAAAADRRARTAIGDILRFYHIKADENSDTIKDFDEQLEFLLRPHGIMRRTVKLEKEWYKDAIGAMIGVRKADGAVVSLLPAGISGYTYFNEEKGKRVRINSGNQELLKKRPSLFTHPSRLRG